MVLNKLSLEMQLWILKIQMKVSIIKENWVTNLWCTHDVDD